MYLLSFQYLFLNLINLKNLKDGSVLKLITPRSFPEGVKEIGFDDVKELKAAYLINLHVKQKLRNSIILNEFVLFMKNFEILSFSDKKEYESNYILDIYDKKDDNKEEDKNYQSVYKKYIENNTEQKLDMEKYTQKKVSNADA